jgi:hypothetical protein
MFKGECHDFGIPECFSKVFEDSDSNEERAGEQEQLHKELRKCLLACLLDMRRF